MKELRSQLLTEFTQLFENGKANAIDEILKKIEKLFENLDETPPVPDFIFEQWAAFTASLIHETERLKGFPTSIRVLQKLIHQEIEATKIDIPTQLASWRQKDTELLHKLKTSNDQLSLNDLQIQRSELHQSQDDFRHKNTALFPEIGHMLKSQHLDQLKKYTKVSSIQLENFTALIPFNNSSFLFSTDRIGVRKSKHRILKQFRFSTDSERISFEKELHYLSQLEHRHIVELQSGFVSVLNEITSGFLEFPFYQAQDLLCWREANPTAGEYAIAKIFSGIKSGMDYLHHKGYAHGNIRPENVLLDDQCHPRISGFGSAVEHQVSENFENSTYLNSPRVSSSIYSGKILSDNSFIFFHLDFCSKLPSFRKIPRNCQHPLETFTLLELVFL